MSWGRNQCQADVAEETILEGGAQLILHREITEAITGKPGRLEETSSGQILVSRHSIALHSAFVRSLGRFILSFAEGYDKVHC